MSKLTELRTKREVIAKLHEESQSALYRAREHEGQVDGLIYAAHLEGASARMIAEVLGVSSLTTIYRRIEKQAGKVDQKGGGF